MIVKLFSLNLYHGNISVCFFPFLSLSSFLLDASVFRPSSFVIRWEY